MKLMLGNAFAITALAVTAQALSANAQEAFIGEIRTFPYNFCPRSWTEAKGQTLPISENTALYSLLGTMYGGDGRSTFALPDFSANNQSEPPPVPDPEPVATEVTIYQHCNYGGWSVTLAPGLYSAEDLDAPFIQDDASALKISVGTTVTLYNDRALDGISQTYTEDVSCLSSTDFNDVLSSLSISASVAPPAPVPAPITSGPKVKTCIALQGYYPSRN